jgi:hypothetical protein
VVVIAASIGGCIMLSQSRNSTGSASEPLSGSPAFAILVQFGLTDEEPRDWDGSVTASASEILSPASE